MMSRLLPRPQLGDRELGPAWAALPACTPLLRDQADGMPGRHCTGRLVPAATEAAQRCQAHRQRRDLALLVLLSAGSQEERGYHLPPAQPSSAQRLGPFPASPASCRSQGWSRGPAGLPGQGASTSSRDAEPQGNSLAQLGGTGGQPTSSLHPQPASPPRGRTTRSAKRQSAMPPATGEEKHPLYYRPQKRPWKCQEDQVYTGCFHFSARGREEGNKPNRPYSRFFGARKRGGAAERSCG